MTIIVALIEQLNSAVFVLIAMLVSFIYCIYIFGRWSGKQEGKESEIEASLNRFETRMDKHEERMDRKMDKIEASMDKKIDKIETRMNEEWNKLAQLDGKLQLIYENTILRDKQMTSSNSPITLTTLGKEVAKKLDAKNIVDRTYAEIKKNIEAKNSGIFDKNAYDIQKVIFAYFLDGIETHLNTDELNSLKIEAYNRGVIVEDLYRILAVMFRDRLLQELKKPVSEIDRHNPEE